MPEGINENASGEQTKITIGGKEYTEEELNSALESHKNKSSWEQSNTKKASSIAEKERQLDAYIKLDEFLKKNPDLSRQVNTLIQDYDPNKTSKGEIPEDMQETLSDPAIKMIYDEMQRLSKTVANHQQYISGIFQDKEDKELTNTTENWQLSAEDLQKVKSHARNLGVSPKVAFKDLFFEKAVEMASQKTEEDTINSIKKGQSPVFLGSRGSSGSSGQLPKLNSMQKAVNRGFGLDDESVAKKIKEIEQRRKAPLI